MAELTVAMTYGQALLEAACDLGKTKEVSDSLAELSKVFAENPEFFTFLKARNIRAVDKKKAFRSVMSGQLEEAVINLMFILLDKGRVTSFEQIVREYNSLLNKQEGYAYGTIVSAQPLKPEQLERFELEAGKLLGSKVKLEQEVDKSLIGGVKMYVEGKLLDASVKSRLQTLADSLK